MFLLQAIYELYRGEQDLIEDLQLARKVENALYKIMQRNPNAEAPFVLTLYFHNQAYHDPMLKLSIITEEELAHIFGDLDAYIPLHEGRSPIWI